MSLDTLIRSLEKNVEADPENFAAKLALRRARLRAGSAEPTFTVDLAREAANGAHGDLSAHAAAIRAVLKKAGLDKHTNPSRSGFTRVAVKTQRHSMVDSIYVAYEPQGELLSILRDATTTRALRVEVRNLIDQTKEAVAAFFHVRTATDLCVWNREDRSNAQSDYFEPRGPMIDPDYQETWLVAFTKTQERVARKRAAKEASSS